MLPKLTFIYKDNLNALKGLIHRRVSEIVLKKKLQ